MTAPTIEIEDYTFLATDIGDVIVASEQFSELVVPGEAAGNFYFQSMPDDPDFAVSLWQYPGESPLATNGNPVLVEKPRLQTLVRHPNTEDAWAMVYRLWRFLGALKDFEVNGSKYMKVTALGSPSEVGPDQKNRQRWTCNYSVWRDNSDDE